MSAERHAEPAITQALEEVRSELLAEQRALETLPREGAGLRARLERLQAERDALHQELEAFRQGWPAKTPRLPAVLAPPFEVHTRISLLRLLRGILPPLLMAGALVSRRGDGFIQILMVLMGVSLGGIMVGRVIQIWRARSRWRFREEGIEVGGKGVPRGFVPYAEILDAETQISASQQRRGVGTVLVEHRVWLEGMRGGLLSLKDVPEPERLAEWIRSKRPGTE